MVDRDGYYISTTEECVDVAHKPDNDDLWTCIKCHYEDTGSAFEIVDKIEPKKEEGVPRICMKADFRILKKHGDGPVDPIYLSIRKENNLKGDPEFKVELLKVFLLIWKVKRNTLLRILFLMLLIKAITEYYNQPPC